MAVNSNRRRNGMSENLPEANNPKTPRLNYVIHAIMILVITAVLVIVVLALMGPTVGTVYSNIGGNL
jgi:hypothetical protein